MVLEMASVTVLVQLSEVAEEAGAEASEGEVASAVTEIGEDLELVKVALGIEEDSEDAAEDFEEALVVDLVIVIAAICMGNPKDLAIQATSVIKESSILL